MLGSIHEYCSDQCLRVRTMPLQFLQNSPWKAEFKTKDNEYCNFKHILHRVTRRPTSNNKKNVRGWLLLFLYTIIGHDDEESLCQTTPITDSNSIKLSNSLTLHFILDYKFSTVAIDTTRNTTNHVGNKLIGKTKNLSGISSLSAYRLK
jgi:hypothetical protein